MTQIAWTMMIVTGLMLLFSRKYKINPEKQSPEQVKRLEIKNRAREGRYTFRPLLWVIFVMSFPLLYMGYANPVKAEEQPSVVLPTVGIMVSMALVVAVMLWLALKLGRHTGRVSEDFQLKPSRQINSDSEALKHARTLLRPRSLGQGGAADRKNNHWEVQIRSFDQIWMYTVRFALDGTQMGEVAAAKALIKDNRVAMRLAEGYLPRNVSAETHRILVSPSTRAGKWQVNFEPKIAGAGPSGKVIVNAVTHEVTVHTDREAKSRS